MNPKRQGMTVSIKELRDLADELEKEMFTLPEVHGHDYNQKWLINIINKTGASDTWEIEK